MQLRVDPAAAAYIREEGGAVVISPGSGGGCCNMGAQLQPQADLGQPSRPLDQFRVIEEEGVTIYLDLVLDRRVEATYRLHLTTFLNFKYLEVSFDEA